MTRRPLGRALGFCALAAAGAPALAAGATAEQELRLRFDVPPGELAAALDAFARQAGIALAYDRELTRGKTTDGLSGTHTVVAGFTALLADSGLETVATASGAMTLRPVEERAGITPLSRVTVSGHRLPDTQQGATKMTLPLRETPQAVSIVSRESMDGRQALDLATAVELTAGVAAVGKAFAGHNPRTGESFFLRGQELDSSRDVRVDGFTAGGDRNNFDLAPFQAVEVVKGPSSMLYGQGSLGGFINLVRRRPLAERTFDLSMQAGSYDTYRADINATGGLDADGTVTSQATLAYEDSGSFIDGVDSRRLVVAPGIEWAAGERTRIRADVIYQEDRFSASLGIPLRSDGDRLRHPDVSRSFFFGVPSSEDSEASALHATLTVEQEISDRWLATLMLHRSRNELLGIADSYGYGIDDAGNTSLYASYVGHDNENWAGELRIDGRFEAFGREHNLLVGVEMNGFDFDSWGGYSYDGPIGTANIYDGSLATAPSIPALSLPQAYTGRDTGDNEGIYAQLLLGLRDETRLLLGARYDRTESDGRFDGIFGGFTDGEDSSADTYRIGLTQDLGAHVTGYAVYAESFTPVYESSRQGPLDPETGSGYEIGLKGEWFDGRFLASAALFRQELDNRPIPDPDNAPTESFHISGGKERTDGIELEATGSLGEGWTVQGAAAWLDAEYVDPRDANFGLTPGGTIERQFSLYAEYEFQAGPLRDFAIGATALSVGDRIVLADQNYFIDGYERYDLHVAYRGLPNWEISLLVRNLADETYVERPNSAYLYGHFYGSPRAYMLRADYSVGR